MKILFLLLITSIGCNQATKKENQTTADSIDQVKEKLFFDLNNDNLKDTILLIGHHDSEGQFSEISIKLANIREFKYASELTWTFFDTLATEELNNILDSKRVFGVKNKDNLYLLFFGYEYCCDPSDLTILEVKKDTIKKYVVQGYSKKVFKKNQELFISSRQCIVEPYNTIDSLNVFVANYAPYKIYGLRENEAKYIDRLTKWYNNKYYFFRGTECSDNLKVAYPKDGAKPFLLE